jgi:hypothetical protein
VRDANGEVKLVTYAELHGSSGEVDEGLFRKVLLGISCRDYEAAVEAVPGAIGMSKSQVSREFTKATGAKLKEFQERDLGGYDVVALFMDGKTFADDQLVLALGVTMDGDKVFLGFVQTDTENQRVITSFLRSLKDRGLDLSAGALVVVDGAKGLRSGALQGLRGPGPDPALPVAQAGERDLVPAQDGAEAVARAHAEGLRTAHLRGSEAGSEGDPGGARRGEPVRRGEPGRGLRGVADATPTRRLPPRRPVSQDDQRD